MPFCGIRRAYADENGPGDFPAGSAKRLDRSRNPGPFRRFTFSKIGRHSLPGDGGMQQHRLSRFEKGTIVHLWRIEMWWLAILPSTFDVGGFRTLAA